MHTWQHVRFDWNHARAFLVTAQEGSLSAAARALGMTQPTLGRQVAALEQSFQVTLFERDGKQLRLTESGGLLLEHVQAMASAAGRFSLAASGQSQALQGNVCVSVSEVDAVYRMPDIVAALREEEPGIALDIVVSNQVSDLTKREADIALRSFRPEQPDLIVKKILDERIGLYASAGYIRSIPGDATFADYQLIGFERQGRMPQVMAEHGWSLVEGQLPIVTPFQMLHVALAKRGMGVIFFPMELASCEPDLQLTPRQLAPELIVPLWLVSHRELRTNPRVRRVFDVMAQQLQP